MTAKNGGLLRGGGCDIGAGGEAVGEESALHRAAREGESGAEVVGGGVGGGGAELQFGQAGGVGAAGAKLKFAEGGVVEGIAGEAIGICDGANLFEAAFWAIALSDGD